MGGVAGGRSMSAPTVLVVVGGWCRGLAAELARVTKYGRPYGVGARRRALDERPYGAGGQWLFLRSIR